MKNETFTPERIKAEADAFFEWDGEDRSLVTTTSCLLFAQHIAGLIQDRAAQPAPVVPEGYVLVPIKPTIEMVEAGYEEGIGKPDRSGHARVIEQYDAMLAAASAQGQQVEFGDAYQGAREDLAIWKRRALEAEEKVRKAEQSIPAAIEVIGYASPRQVEILRSLPSTGGMKVRGCKDGRYTEPVVLLSAARAELFATVIRCEQAGAFKMCMECGYQDGHDEICKFHDSNRAAQDQGEVQRLREALNWLRGAINCTAENDVDQCGAWISTKHPMIQRIDELLAASAGQGVECQECERLRMQLTACGVVALSNTPESAAKARDMHSDYMSASCQDVMRAVDSEMALRAELAVLKAQPEAYQFDGQVLRDEHGNYLAEFMAYEQSFIDRLLHPQPALKAQQVGVIREAETMGVAPYADIWPWLVPGTKLYTLPPAERDQDQPQ